MAIRALFTKHRTNYKIVIAPLYAQVKLHPDAMALLDSVFQKEYVYDYSGINELTNNIYNYASDVIHYRKKAGNIIFKEIYSRQ